jgi:hypothetical protein
MILAASPHRYLQLTCSRFADRGSNSLEHLRSPLDHSSPHLSRKRQLSLRTVDRPNGPHLGSVQHTPVCPRRHQQHPSPASRATASRLRPTPHSNRSTPNSLWPRSLARSVASRRHSSRAHSYRTAWYAPLALRRRRGARHQPFWATVALEHRTAPRREPPFRASRLPPAAKRL